MKTLVLLVLSVFSFNAFAAKKIDFKKFVVIEGRFGLDLNTRKAWPDKSSHKNTQQLFNSLLGPVDSEGFKYLGIPFSNGIAGMMVSEDEARIFYVDHLTKKMKKIVSNGELTMYGQIATEILHALPKPRGENMRAGATYRQVANVSCMKGVGPRGRAANCRVENVSYTVETLQDYIDQGMLKKDAEDLLIATGLIQ